MTGLIFTFATTALGITFWELVKQVGVRMAQAYMPSAVVTGLKTLDKMLPTLIEEKVPGDQLEDLLRKELGNLTGSEWKKIRTEFDPAVFLNSLLK
jgi:hypothetical protein